MIHIIDEEPWRRDAVCAQTDPESFFPEKGSSSREAKSVCLGCTVSAECLDYALANDVAFGIWGGPVCPRAPQDRRPAQDHRGASMTTTTITDELKITILKHLASGKGLDVVAAIVSLPRETVLDIGSRHGYPDVEKLAWAADVIAGKLTSNAAALPVKRPAPQAAPPQPAAPQTAGAVASTPAAPAPAQPDEIRALVNTAMQHPSKRIQNAAGKVVDDIAKLRTLIREDEEKHAERRKADAAKAAARAEVERLEQQLAAAKAKLRGDKPALATKTPASSKAATAPKGEHPCRNDGCDRVFDTGQGRSLHERLRCEHRPAAEAS